MCNCRPYTLSYLYTSVSSKCNAQIVKIVCFCLQFMAVMSLCTSVLDCPQLQIERGAGNGATLHVIYGP